MGDFDRFGTRCLSLRRWVVLLRAFRSETFPNSRVLLTIHFGLNRDFYSYELENLGLSCNSSSWIIIIHLSGIIVHRIWIIAVTADSPFAPIKKQTVPVLKLGMRVNS